MLHSSGNCWVYVAEQSTPPSAQCTWWGRPHWPLWAHCTALAAQWRVWPEPVQSQLDQALSEAVITPMVSINLTHFVLWDQNIPLSKLPTMKVLQSYNNYLRLNVLSNFSTWIVPTKWFEYFVTPRSMYPGPVVQCGHESDRQQAGTGVSSQWQCRNWYYYSVAFHYSGNQQHQENLFESVDQSIL